MSPDRYDPRMDLINYKFPTLDLLRYYSVDETNSEVEEAGKLRIIKALQDFDIEIDTINYTVGPTTVLYEITLAPGIPLSELEGLDEDLAFALCVDSVSIMTIPRKGTIGIVIPNNKPRMVSIESVLNTRKFAESSMSLPIALGRTITNETFVFDLTKAPHLLVSGSTGTGKSVALHTIITSLLYKKHPAELKFVLMDPSGAEFGNYESIKNHFLASTFDRPAIITRNCDAVSILESLCIEMEQRYELLKQANVRSVQDYNEMFKDRRLNPASGHRYLPYIVVIIDSYNTLALGYEEQMMQHLFKLARNAGIVGIHLVISSILPTDDLLSSNIKTYLSTRISFKVPERSDSEIILDCDGAEKLSRPGDLLFRSEIDLIHVQCAFIDTSETNCICQFISRQQGYLDSYPLPDVINPEEASYWKAGGEMGNFDPLLPESAHLVVINQLGATSLIQRKFAIGYNRAGRILDQLEAIGIVGRADGARPRPVFVSDERQLERILETYNLQ